MSFWLSARRSGSLHGHSIGVSREYGRSTFFIGIRQKLVCNASGIVGHAFDKTSEFPNCVDQPPLGSLEFVPRFPEARTVEIRKDPRQSAGLAKRTSVRRRNCPVPASFNMTSSHAPCQMVQNLRGLKASEPEAVGKLSGVGKFRTLRASKVA
jgi:hypothetical protein